MPKNTLLEYAEVRNWLDRLSPDSRKSWLSRLQGVLRWLRTQPEFNEVDPSELVRRQQESKRSSNPKDEYEILDKLQTYISNECGHMSVASKKGVYSVVRSYFLHNRAPLPQDRSFKIRGTKRERQAVFTIQHLRNLAAALEPHIRPVALVLTYSMMDLARFDWFNRNAWHTRMGPKQRTPPLREQIQNNIDPVKIEFEERKGNDRPFYTFLGGYALTTLRDHLKARGEIGLGEAIFLNPSGNPVNRQNIDPGFITAAERLGIVKRVMPQCPNCKSQRTKRVRRNVSDGRQTRTWKGFECLDCAHEFRVPRTFFATIRYGVNPHEIRDVVRSYLHTCEIDAQSVEFWMGHQVDPLRYNQFFEKDPEWCENQYREAAKELDKVFIFSSVRDQTKSLRKLLDEKDEYVRVLEDRLRAEARRIDDVLEMVKELRAEIESQQRATRVKPIRARA